MFPATLPAPRRHPENQIHALRWGIVGHGWIADHFANALHHYTQQQLVAVLSRTLDKAQAFAHKWEIPHAVAGIDALLSRDDIDVVYIVTPHNHHFPDGLRTLRAVKHVLIEKPLALNAQQAQQLQARSATAVACVSRPCGAILHRNTM